MSVSETLPAQDASRQILVVDDDATLRGLLMRQIENLGFSATGAGSMAEAREHIEADRPDMVLLDQRLPDADGVDALPELIAHCPVVVLTAYGSVNQAVGAVKAGAADYLTKPISPQMLELAIERVFDAARLRGEVGLLRREMRHRTRTALIGTSPQIERARARAQLLATTQTPVLILGEWGTGKRTLARFIHENGPRAERNFVEVQCARMDGNALLDELFGEAEPGLLESAAGGTLFLSDIARMPPGVQRRLAGSLETGRFTRRGSRREIALQVRVIAASGQPMAEISGEGGLVPELFYLLSAFTLELPPLRERKRDIPDLARELLERRTFALAQDKRLSKQTIKRLQAWQWPGNLRELRNVIERGIILSGNSRTIRPEHVEIGETVISGGAPDNAISVADEPTLERLGDRYLDMLLQKHGDNRREVARILDVSERSVYRMLARRRQE